MKYYLTVLAGCILATSPIVSYAGNEVVNLSQSTEKSGQQISFDRLLVLQASKAKITKVKKDHYQLIISKENINHVLKFNQFPSGNMSYVNTSQFSKDWVVGKYHYNHGSQNASLIMGDRVIGIDITSIDVSALSVSYDFYAIKNSDNPLPLCGNIPGMSKVSLCNKLFTVSLVTSFKGSVFLP
jgi:hypothetical protein